MKTVLVALLASVTASCASVGGGATPSSGIAYPAGPRDLVLRVSTSGGLMPAHFHMTQLPSLSLYGDGKLITMGAQIAIFPGPAMPPLQMSQVTPAGMQRILRAAQAAGLLGPDRHYDYPGFADAGTTEFTVSANGQTHKVSAYALSEGLDTSRLPAEDRRARELLLAFQRDLSDVRGRLGSDIAGPEQPYVAEAIRIVVSAADPKGADDPNLVRVLDWPLGDLAVFGEPRGDLRCGVLQGAELDRVRADLVASHQLTFWRSGGKTYRLDLRPLLPDESGCPPVS